MRKNNKFVSKNYYTSPYPDEYLQKLQRRNIASVFVAIGLFIPVIIIWAVVEIKSLLWIYGAYEAQFFFIALYALGLLGLIFCAINNFRGYKIRRVVKHKDAPSLGFKKTAYNGQLFTAALVSAFTLYLLVLFIGYHIADGVGYIDKVISNNNLDKSGGFDNVGLAVLLISLAASAAAWMYYTYAFRANRAMQYVRVDSDETSSSKEAAKLDKPRPTFRLSEEEIAEASKHEFVQPEETPATDE